MDDHDVDDPDERDDFIAAWEEVDREALEVLRAALVGHQGRPPPTAELASAAARIREEMRADLYPLSWVRSAAALEPGSLPDDGAELLLRCASATISPREQTGLEMEEEAALLSLEHADWLAAVIVTVREGAGHEASAEVLADAVSHCPEVPAGGRARHRRRASARSRVLDCRAGLGGARLDRSGRVLDRARGMGPAASACTRLGRRVRSAEGGARHQERGRSPRS